MYIFFSDAIFVIVISLQLTYALQFIFIRKPAMTRNIKAFAKILRGALMVQNKLAQQHMLNVLSTQTPCSQDGNTMVHLQSVFVSFLLYYLFVNSYKKGYLAYSNNFT